MKFKCICAKRIRQHNVASRLIIFSVDFDHSFSSFNIPKENTNLPVTVTMIFDEKGKLLTGGDVAAVVALLEGLRVDAIGLNCGMGPKQMMPVMEELLSVTSLPVIMKPNAGSVAHQYPAIPHSHPEYVLLFPAA